MMRASVDFPQPLSPTIASVLPFSTEKLTPLTACTVREPAKQAAADMIVADDVLGFENGDAHDAAPVSAGSNSIVGNGRQPVADGVFRQGRQQRARIVALRRFKQRQHVRLLHLAALVLNHDAVGGFGDDAHIVGDHDQPHAVFGLQPDQQIEDLFLDGHVERGRRLVSDQQLRIAGDRHGDHHALALAARHLVRKGTEPLLRLGDTDKREELDGARPALRLVHAHVEAQHFLDLKADGEAGIEAGHRLLEDHGDVLADDLAPLRRVELQQIDAVELHLVGGNGGAVGQQAHDGQHRHRLARAGLADDRQHFALLDRKIDAVAPPGRGRSRCRTRR